MRYQGDIHEARRRSPVEAVLAELLPQSAAADAEQCGYASSAADAEQGGRCGDRRPMRSTAVALVFWPSHGPSGDVRALELVERGMARGSPITVQ